MATRKSPRDGVVLLIVLSLLVLFIFIGVTFIVVAGIKQRSETRFATVEERGDNPALLLDDALMQLVRGTKTASSSLWEQSILEDMYGNDDYANPYGPLGFRGTVTSATLSSDGYFFILEADLNGTNSSTSNNTSLPDYFSGRVFTMLNGPAAGLSTHIVLSSSPPSVPTQATLAIEYPSGAGVPLTAADFSEHTFLINGRAYNGTGAGFQETSGKADLDLQLPGIGETALLPHYARYSLSELSSMSPLNEGGMDESWDIADYQNMYLASVPVSLENAEDIIPSFHRPALAQYWHDSLTGDQRRFYIFRPHTTSPDFTGSNPDYPEDDYREDGNERWDVDNDNDSMPDSVWIDLGMPDKTDPSGRLYRPLFAFLVVDLDGRLDLNAAGSLEMIAQNFGQGTADLLPVPDSQGLAAGNTGGVDLPLPRGSGLGAADMNPVVIFGIPEETLRIALGRYGSDGVPGASGSEDLLSAWKEEGIPDNFAGALPTDHRAYGFPPDLRGLNAVFLDWRGEPVTHSLFPSSTATDNDPYELNLLRPDGTDTPYTLADLELLLRWNDADASSLSRRLVAAAPESLSGSSEPKRRRVTTRSSYVPVPATQLRPGERNDNQSPPFLQLVAQRLRDGGVAEADIPQQLALMVPFEILRGGQMNLNRLMGNGFDENGNLVADDPEELANTVDNYLFDTYGTTISSNYTHGDALQTNNAGARQIYARQLFCMMMFLLDTGYTFPIVEDVSAFPGAESELTARRVAQWAVNCVDFRDADSIMTPFMYDPNPFDGWNVSENFLTPNGPVVWGCEYPDLVISETLAFHDTRLADTDADPSALKRKKPDDSEGDDDLDSVRIPQGSLFLELRCMGNAANPALPRELYDENGNLDLARKAPNGSPVWRVVIGHPANADDSPWARVSETGPTPNDLRPDTTSFDPLDMNRLYSTLPEPLGSTPAESIERVIWFTDDPGGTPGAAGLEDRTFYNRTSNTLLSPGQYAVVGPRDVTYIGRQKTAVEPPGYRIELTPDDVLSYDISGTVQSRTVGTDMQAPVPIICAANPPSAWTTLTDGIGISISEPLPQSGNYYPEPTVQISTFPTVDGYYDSDSATGAAIDKPLDEEAGAPLEEQLDTHRNTGTTVDFKSAFLQRLANPLLDYHPLTNPYITVDWATIDLTVFNGEDEEPTGWAVPFDWDPGDSDPDGPDPEEQFTSRERGIREGDPVQGTGQQAEPGTFWSPVTLEPFETQANAAVDLYFNHEMVQTLGYLNWTMGDPLASGDAPAAYIGEPEEGPIPWLAVLNRPFSSPYELLLVPASEPGRLTFEFSTLQDPGDVDPYHPDATDPEDEAAQFNGAFTHLLNFFHGNEFEETGTAEGANFYRLLDYVEVPSQFAGTENYFDPTVFQTPSLAGFTTPFNYFPRFRVPGRVNINTIPVDGHHIWRAVSGLPEPASDIQWSDIWGSRAETPADPAYLTYLEGLGEYDPDRGVGTSFPSVFQAASTADMAPLLALKRGGSQAGILREGDEGQPLLAYGGSGNDYDDPENNAYFRYQRLIRAGNLVSTQSNVFAVWITVGFFEVDPDTRQLLQEVGASTGEIERHRAFFIIDRSVPVAFEPGENHNVRNCVLLERFLE